MLQFRCSVCYTPSLTLDMHGICEPCRLYPLIVSRARFLWFYKSEVRDFISSMKYSPSPKLCRLAGKLLGSNLANLFPTLDWDVVIPVPSSRQSLKKRQFNQCQIIAKSMIKAAQLSSRLTCQSSGLLHRGYRTPQALLTPRKRLSNVLHAFGTSACIPLKGQKILLLDDVATTGATSTAASVALLKAGAASVDLVTLARSQLWSKFRWEVYRTRWLGGNSPLG